MHILVIIASSEESSFYQYPEISTWHQPKRMTETWKTIWLSMECRYIWY